MFLKTWEPRFKQQSSALLVCFCIIRNLAESSMSPSIIDTPDENGTITRKRRKVTRTRSGCLTCRRRRKACDMVKPECGACLRLKKVCPLRGPKLYLCADQCRNAAGLARRPLRAASLRLSQMIQLSRQARGWFRLPRARSDQVACKGRLGMDRSTI